MRSVVVTGGTTRMGLAISRRLGAAGWRVITTSHRADAGADVVADLSEPAGAAHLFAAACAANGGAVPDALVNNAALFSGDAAAIESVNAVSPEKLTVMMAGREEGTGAVVNVLDSCVLAAARPGAEEGAYEASKRRLLAYTAKSAAMFAGSLRVNAVAPGPVLAPVCGGVAAGETPLGRPSAEDVARAVEFLLSAERTSGCTIPVDGGQSLL